MYTLIVKQHFDAAHQIPGYDGKCANIHGHTYKVEAEFQSAELNELGMVHDFCDLKLALHEVMPDHQFLNDVLPGHTTVEGIARYLFEQLKAKDLPIRSVSVFEGDSCGCRFQPED